MKTCVIKTIYYTDIDSHFSWGEGYSICASSHTKWRVFVENIDELSVRQLKIMFMFLRHEDNGRDEYCGCTKEDFYEDEIIFDKKETQLMISMLDESFQMSNTIEGLIEVESVLGITSEPEFVSIREEYYMSHPKPLRIDLSKISTKTHPPFTTL